MPPLEVAGAARPALPAPTYGEDFSLLVRVRRMRIVRNRIRVLS